MASKTPHQPILFVDVDGVISLFEFPSDTRALPGPLYTVDGIDHCIPTEIGPRLVTLAERFELVWATGWEERANQHLIHLLELPFGELAWLSFDGHAVFGSADWKVDAVDAYAGDRPAAWIDDNIDETCRAWADSRPAPTLLIQTRPSVGLTDEHVDQLLAWAEELS